MKRPDTERFTHAMFFPNENVKAYIIDHTHPQGAWHSHDYMQIWYIYRGTCTHCVLDSEHELTAGDAFLVPPHVTHRTTYTDGTVIYGCEFNANVFIARSTEQGNTVGDTIALLLFLFREIECIAHIRISAKDQAQFESVIRTMSDEYAQKRVAYQELLTLDVLHLLMLITRVVRERSLRDQPTQTEATYE